MASEGDIQLSDIEIGNPQRVSAAYGESLPQRPNQGLGRLLLWGDPRNASENESADGFSMTG